MQGGSHVASGVEEGDILAGKYRIDEILGSGGMGVVVAAHHIHLDEKVAIKFLVREALHNAEAVARFAREARAAVKIKSEHVARVIDVGMLETGAPYMVMEYLEGWDLSALVERTGSLPVEQAVEFVLQACEAMADAHGLGIVHRDLKPSNLFCIRQSDGMLSIKVLDFGISKMTGLKGSGPDLGMTSTTAVMGSPLYMSPEQMQSARSADARSDIWSIGVILYELLAGRVPFFAEAMPELCVKIMTAPPPPLASFRSDVPPGLEQAIFKCLEKDRANRHQNVAELAIALAEFGPKRSRASVEKILRVIQNAGLSASAPALFPSSPPSRAPAAAGTLASWGRTGRGTTRMRSKVGMVGAGIITALAIGSGGFLLARRGPAPSAAGSATGLVSQAPVPAVTPPSSGNALPVPPAPAPSAESPVPAPSAAAAQAQDTSAKTAVPAKAPMLLPASSAAAPARPGKAGPKPAAKGSAPGPPAAKPNDLGGRL